MKVAIAVLLLVPLLAASPAGALPPNPERPVDATDCDRALARVREAAVGSPLVSARENKAHLMAAIAQAERVCATAATPSRKNNR